MISVIHFVFHKPASFSEKGVGIYGLLSFRELLHSSNKNDNKTDLISCKYGAEALLATTIGPTFFNSHVNVSWNVNFILTSCALCWPSPTVGVQAVSARSQWNFHVT
jgi:hypothetical protein